MKTPHNPLPAAKACFAVNFNEALRAKGIPADAKQIARKLVLSERWFLSTQKIRGWLTGRELPAVGQFNRLAAWLEYDKDDLLPECYQHLLKG